MKLKYTVLALAMGSVALSSCNDFLDKMPDNRTTINTEEKVVQLLTSAYPQNSNIFVNEYMSDNVDDNGVNNPYTNRFADQVYAWQDVTESDNESPESFYQACYRAIASANAALQAIDEAGGATTDKLRQARAEALLCRAYNHFLLVNMFSMAYNDQTSTKDLGMPYIEKPEEKVGVTYERGTVAEDYEKIDRDLQAALPDVGDANYTVPKYHFNQQAAYAFATRFYLFYNKWKKAVEYANRVLGTNAGASLRDYNDLANMTQTEEAVQQRYIDASVNANLMLQTAYSRIGLAFGAYYTLGKYSHGAYVSKREDGYATNIWGSPSLEKFPIRRYSGTNLNKYIYWRTPYLFEYKDLQAQTGYHRTVYPAFTTDEVLLERAEAYTLLKQYDKAAADLNTWMHNFVNTSMTLTPENISEFYNAQDYCYSDADGIKSGLKKHLNPVFSIDAEGSTQENMLQCVLGFKRIETLQLGLRWFDIKRYRIVIPRRQLNAAGVPAKLTDVLTTDDPRRAVQLPTKVISAGMTPNPRNTK